MLDFLPRFEVDDVRPDAHRFRHLLGHFEDRVGLVGADVHDLAVDLGALHAVRDDRRDIRDVAEGAGLEAVAIDRHGLAFEHLVHEDADHVPVAVAEVLALAVDVVRAEDHEVHPEHLFRLPDIHLGSILGDAVRVFRCRRHVLAHRNLVRAVDGHRRGEDEAPHRPGVDRTVDERGRAEEVVGVVEAADERAEPLGGIRGEVVDVVELVLAEEARDEHGVGDRAVVEVDAVGDVVEVATGEVVEADDGVAHREQFVGDVGSDKPGDAGDEGDRSGHGNGV